MFDEAGVCSLENSVMTESENGHDRILLSREKTVMIVSDFGQDRISQEASVKAQIEAKIAVDCESSSSAKLEAGESDWRTPIVAYL